VKVQCRDTERLMRSSGCLNVELVNIVLETKLYTEVGKRKEEEAFAALRPRCSDVRVSPANRTKAPGVEALVNGRYCYYHAELFGFAPGRSCRAKRGLLVGFIVSRLRNHQVW